MLDTGCDIIMCMHVLHVEYEEAIELYSEALRVYPEDCSNERAVCHANRAACHVKMVSHAYSYIFGCIMYTLYTVCSKTFEGKNFRSCAQNTLFTGKLSR